MRPRYPAIYVPSDAQVCRHVVYGRRFSCTRALIHIQNASACPVSISRLYVDVDAIVFFRVVPVVFLCSDRVGNANVDIRRATNYLRCGSYSDLRVWMNKRTSDDFSMFQFQLC